MPALTSLLIAGLAISAVGTATSVVGAQKAASAQKDMAEQQQQQNALRQQAMELDAHRKQIQVMRDAQKARSTALSNATAQGAGLGSGLQGGYGQIGGDAESNSLGINQGVQLGRENFALDSNISSDKMSLASAQGISSWGTGLSGFGSALINTASVASKAGQGIGNSGGQDWLTEQQDKPSSGSWTS